MLEVKYKKLFPDAKDPIKIHYGDVGFDLTARTIRETEDFVEYGTGIAIELPVGYCGLLFPRSSNSKKDLLLCNSIGLIDGLYFGELMFRYKRLRDKNRISKAYSPGDVCGQLVIMPYPEIYMTCVSELNVSGTRGTGGFGSTDNIPNIGLMTPSIGPEQLALQFQDSISKGDPPNTYGFKQNITSIPKEITNYHTLTDPTGDYLRTTKDAQVHAL
jgi:dUTP pyrophosphatase